MRPSLVFLSGKNPYTKKSWSGIPFFLVQSLKEHFQVTVVAGPQLKGLYLIGYYVSRFVNLITGRKYVFDYGIIPSWFYARYYKRKLKTINADVLFTPAGFHEIALLDTSIPIVTYGDCSVLQMIDYYPALKKVASVSVREMKFIEGKAVLKSNLNILSSVWAADFIRRTYGVSSVEVIPFGANLENPPLTFTPRALGTSELKLLFVGVDWVRKGGNIAVQIFHLLKSRNINCSLVVIGSAPSELPDDVTVIPHLDKNSEKGEELYLKLLSEAHFMLLPTRADCTPIVIAEAFSCGLPVLAADTGGIASMIADGQNGYLFSSLDPNCFVEKIVYCIQNNSTYKELQQNARNSFENVFNWQKWGEEIAKLIKNVVVK